MRRLVWLGAVLNLACASGAILADGGDDDAPAAVDVVASGDVAVSDDGGGDASDGEAPSPDADAEMPPAGCPHLDGDPCDTRSDRNPCHVCNDSGGTQHICQCMTGDAGTGAWACQDTPLSSCGP